MAVAAGVTDHLPGTMTPRTGLLHSEEALLHAHLTMTATGGTGGRLGTLLGTAAVTGLAAHQGRHLDGHGGTAHNLFQVQLQGIAQIAAALHRGTAATAARSEERRVGKEWSHAP